MSNVTCTCYLFTCFPFITELTTTTVEPETTTAKQTHKFTSKPKSTHFPDMIIKIYHKVMQKAAKHLELVIFGVISLGVMSLIILFCMCRYENVNVVINLTII